MSDKKVLRARMRATRDAFVADAVPTIPADPRFVARLTPGMVIASYRPVGSEADPVALEEAALARGCTLALPHVVDRATPLRFLAWHKGADLAAGPFGLANPHHHWPEAVPDVILTPLLAFDPALNRLGQGAGHYDRAFDAFPSAWRLGLAWSIQRLDLLPADPWDVPLHAIITEHDWWTR